MNIIRKYCILCGLYKGKSKMHIVDKAGVCKDCFLELTRTPDMTFAGSGDVKMVIAPYLYKGAICEAVRKFKFFGQWKYGEIFSRMICEELAKFSWLSGFDMVIPVPLHQIRQDERGYNQAEIIARGFAKSIGVPMVCDALFRIRETKRQSSLVGMDRVLNVRGAFVAAESAVRDKRVILVDDVCTMGKTMEACADALTCAGAKEVIGVALCKSEVQ